MGLTNNIQDGNAELIRVQKDTKKIAEKIRDFMNKKERSRFSLDTVINTALKFELKRLNLNYKIELSDMLVQKVKKVKNE